MLEPLPSTLASALDAEAGSLGLPGLAVAGVARGRRFGHVFGVDAPGSARPVSASTWFSLASTAKHATAAAVLELAQDGLVDLQDPVGRHLTDLPAGWGDRSIDALLHHTSGLPEYLSAVAPEDVPSTRRDFVARFAALAPIFDPGEAWMYSNTNYIVLAMLVAQRRSTSFVEAVKRLTDRVGARGVAVASPDWTREANAAQRGPDAVDLASARREVIGDGDLSMTVEGAAAWLHALLGGTLLDRRWRDAMFRSTPLASGRHAPYGCGWFVDRVGRQRVAHHAGHFDGSTAMAYLAPALDAGVLVMCNLAPGNTRAVRHLAQRAIEGLAPGSTPLSLEPIDDDAPALTAMARAQLLRGDAPLDPGCLATELLRLAERAGPVRNVVNLWAGQPPRAFSLVEQRVEGASRYRRYRLAYDGRTEHALVGTTAEDKLFWAWPL